MNLMLARDGRQYGPYSLEQVNAMVASGRAGLDDLAWLEGSPEWVPLRAIDGVIRVPPPLRMAAAPREDGSSERLILPAFLLAFFLGVFGVHRFYVGRTGSGIAMVVLTLTLVGVLITSIWSIIDWVVILCGDFRDDEGKPLRRWT